MLFAENSFGNSLESSFGNWFAIRVKLLYANLKKADALSRTLSHDLRISWKVL